MSDEDEIEIPDDPKQDLKKKRIRHRLAKVEVEGTGMLKIMRHVLVNGFYHDDKYGEQAKIYRRWKKNDETGFMKKYHELETLELKKPVAGASVWGIDESDEGEARSLKLLDRLLASREAVHE